MNSKEPNENILIRVTDVIKTFKTSAGEFNALNGISLEVKKGEFLSVTGKSGSGKSTLMNLLAGIDRPTTGEIQIGEKSVHTMSESAMAKWRGKSVGVIFQFFQLLPTLSVMENIMLPMDFCSVFPLSQRKERALDLLKRVGIEDQAYKFPSALSGGQQQRAAIARALANDPSLLLADEPTGNLDSVTADHVFKIFEELASSGKTILLVTHDRDIAAKCSRRIELVDGRVASIV